MSYLNNQTGYREDILTSRSIVKKNNYLLLEVDGLVKNSIPGYSDCDVTILSSPELGASFADYYITARPGGKNEEIGGDGIESFIYVIDGQLTVKNPDEEAKLTTGGYMYSPSDKPISFVNNSEKETKAFLYKRRYNKYKDLSAKTVVNNIDNLEWIDYEGMKNCVIKDLLPASGNFGFDMNMHILKFEPGASHGYIETHIQEHGMIFLQGKGMYNLDNDWMPVKKGDYIFMDAYCPQACYGVGDEPFVYLYSKDCNRDVEL